MQSPRHALVVGATGLVGSHCLQLLLAHPTYDRVTIVVRRPTQTSHPKLREHVVDFEHLEQAAQAMAADDVYACLGTTMKKAGSKAAFRRVDHDYTVAVATLAREHGAARLALVSSIGASASSANFYLRVKGETERDVSALGYETVEIMRPSFLVGKRTERRAAEEAGIAAVSWVAGLMVGPLQQYRPVKAEQVAAAMVESLVRGQPGIRIRTWEDIGGRLQAGGRL